MLLVILFVWKQGVFQSVASNSVSVETDYVILLLNVVVMEAELWWQDTAPKKSFLCFPSLRGFLIKERICSHSFKRSFLCEWISSIWKEYHLCEGNSDIIDKIFLQIWGSVE